MKILGIIPARKGSKGIKDKNLYPLCGIKMIDYTIFSAWYSNLDDVVVSTDYESGVIEFHNVITRPNYLCTDEAKSIDVIKHIVEQMPDYDAYMLLQPTSPLRERDDINNAIKMFIESGANSLYSGYLMHIKENKKIFLKKESKLHFQRNGAIFITKKELILEGKIWDDDVVEFIMPKSKSIDIDDMDDAKVAESIIYFNLVKDLEG